MLGSLRVGPRLVAMALQSLAVAMVPLVVTASDVARHQAGLSLIALGTFLAGWELYILTTPLMRNGVSDHRLLGLNAPTQFLVAALLTVPITYLAYTTSSLMLLLLTFSWLVSSLFSQEATRLLYARGAVGAAGSIFLIRPCGPLLLMVTALASGRTVTLEALVVAWSATSIAAMVIGIALTRARTPVEGPMSTNPRRLDLFLGALPFIFSGIGVRVVLVVEAVALAQLADSRLVGMLAAGIVVTAGIQAFYDALVLIPLQGRLLAAGDAAPVLRLMWRQTLVFTAVSAPLAFVAAEVLRRIWQFRSFPYGAWSLLLLAALLLVASSPWHARLLNAHRGRRLALWASVGAAVAVAGAAIAVLSESVLLVAVAKLVAAACLFLGRMLEVWRLDGRLSRQLS